MLDLRPVRAFLDSEHEAWACTAAKFASAELARRPEPVDDDAGRIEARDVLSAMGAAGLLDPIGTLDLRACCLAREAIAAASPLADAVWALQGLGITPLLLAGSDRLREQWAPGALAGEIMSAFAMTEPDAGSDVASMKTRAVRDGDDYVLDGHKWLISNAGIADYYVVFASTDPEAGSRGISAFLVPAETEGLTFAGAQVMSAPHPLGELQTDGVQSFRDEPNRGRGSGVHAGNGHAGSASPDCGGRSVWDGTARDRRGASPRHGS